MVRLVFRPYTQIRRSICTSESLRASTRVSSGFTLFRHSSPSFGSQHACSTTDPSQKLWTGRWCTPRQGSQLSLSLRAWVFHSNTCMYVRLLGPCFKTGRLKPLRQHPQVQDTRSHWVPQSQPLYTTKDYNTPKKALHFQSLFAVVKIDAGLPKRKCTRQSLVDFTWTWLTSSVSLSTISRTV
jgi:hypothetical protein